MAKHTATVGDDFDLDGTCMVKHPDGTVVTSNHNYRLTQVGKWEVIYADHVDTITVRPAPEPEPEPEPAP